MAVKTQTAHATALGAALLIGFGLWVQPAQAAYTLTIQPNLTGVTATGAGSINFYGLALYGNELDSSLIAASGGAVIIGPATPTSDTYYSGIAEPDVAFEMGGEFFSASGGGAIVGLGTFLQTSGGVIAVPQGYVSGTPLGTTTATWTDATISGLGLAPGAYVWSWGSGATADSFTLDIVADAGAVPEAATWAMMLLGLAGLAVVRTRRRILASG
jgi:MYXO-CTERM domain-containing protein